MKNSFNRFAIRFPVTAILGMGLLALRGHGFARIFTPLYASPWEMGKLAYWPMLLALLALAGLTGGVRATLYRAAPSLVLTPLALFLICWLASLLGTSKGVYLLIWVVAVAIGLAFSERATGRTAGLFALLAVAMGALYILLTFLPPPWGPFLDPADVAAMAVIPY